MSGHHQRIGVPLFQGLGPDTVEQPYLSELFHLLPAAFGLVASHVLVGRERLLCEAKRQAILPVVA